MLIWMLLALAGQAMPQASPSQLTVAGTITTADGSVLPPMTVVVMPAEPATPEDVSRFRRIEADGGRFEVAGLPAGEYRLAFADTASLSAWPAPELLAELRRASMPLPPVPVERLTFDLTVTSGAGIRRVTGARVAASTMVARRSGPGARGRQPVMPPPPPPAGTSGISGRVIIDGEPARGVRVAALRWIARSGAREPVPSRGSVLTSDDGTFEVTGLRAGEYLVAAFADRTGREAMLGNPVIALPPAVTRPDGSREAFTTTFYPGLTTAEDAGVIRLADGRTVRGIELRMVRMPVRDVSGRIVGPSGEPSRAAQAVLRPAAPADQIGGANVRAATVGAGGEFHFVDVPFGEYDLAVLGSPDPSGDHRVRVDESLEADLEIRLDPPVTIRGRVEFGGPDNAPASYDGIRVRLAAAMLRTGAGSMIVPVRPDGTFEVRGARGSEYRLEADAPLPWQQVTGRIGPFDTLDVPFRLVQDRDDGVVVLASRDTSISGSVKDASGRPLTNGYVVVFPVIPTRRQPNGRYMRILPLAGDGLFATSLPPGEYYAHAFAGGDLDPSGTIDVADLFGFEAEATRFSLEIGEQKRIEITTRR